MHRLCPIGVRRRRAPRSDGLFPPADRHEALRQPQMRSCTAPIVTEAAHRARSHQRGPNCAIQRQGYALDGVPCSVLLSRITSIACALGHSGPLSRRCSSAEPPPTTRNSSLSVLCFSSSVEISRMFAVTQPVVREQTITCPAGLLI